MHFDALTLACVTAELQETVNGGRIQQVIVPDDHSMGFEIYANHQRHYLVAVTEARQSRVQLVSQKLRRGVEQPTPLLLLLRKYVRGALLTAVSQPEPTERVLAFHCDHPEFGTTQLVIEIMGQRSNVLLLNPAGQIMECLRRVWPGERVQRELLPGRRYLPPPQQDKLPPFDDGSPNYYERLGLLTQMAGPLWRVLVEQLVGVSPSQAREVAWRATGESDTPAQAATVLAIAQALQELWAPLSTGEWQPGLWLEDGRLVGFSAYPAHVRGEFLPCPTMSQAVERYYAQLNSDTGAAKLDAYAGLRSRLETELQQAQQRVQRQLAAAIADEPAPGEAERLRMEAEWLLALSSQIAEGQTELVVPLDGQQLTIQLDVTQTPIEQAQQWFKRVAKLERAAAIIPERRKQLEGELAFLAQLAEDLQQATNQPELQSVHQEMEAAGLLPRTANPTGVKTVGKAKAAHKAKRNTPPEPQLLRYYSPQGFEIVVGRNARQNEQITFEVAKAEDLWLHARGAPGSHVIIRNGGQTVQRPTLIMAAQLAAYYSKLRGESVVTVIYTPRRFVSRASGGHTGQVIIREEETITVPGELPVFEE
ncbi:MAG: NFACT family protein [Caldilineaceae bacterium]|nr:NFACT family protein [Caldilineaceae bacterium]